MSTRLFAQSFLAAILIYVLFHALTWKLATEGLITNKQDDGGDLARLSYFSGSKAPRKNYCDLPAKHIEWDQYQKGQAVDVVTIGDSFSLGGAGGRNPYYQDYIASYHNLKVLNIKPRDRSNILAFVYKMITNGDIDTIKPKYLIVEVAEKSCISTLAARDQQQRNKIVENSEPSEIPIAKEAINSKQVMKFINDANIRYFVYNFLYKFLHKSLIGKVYIKKLSHPFFSAKSPDLLLFYRDDVRHIPLATAESVRQMNNNLNAIAAALRTKGVKLYFMPAVDKYNLYSEFIISNNLPKSTLFELLRGLPKQYQLIDTKMILSKELKGGEKDIYYADDTHWSWKASKKIFENVNFD